MKELLDWEKEELELLKKDGQTRTGTDKRNQGGSPVLSVTVRDGPCSSVYSQLKAQLQANALLSLLNLCCWLLDRQVAAQAAAFEQQGGFTERLYRVRSERPRTVDWCLKGAGDGLSVALQEVAGGFTTRARPFRSASVSCPARPSS